MIKAARPDLRKVVKVPEVSRPRVSAAGPFPAVALATTRTPASVVRVPLLCGASIWSAALCPSGLFMVFCSACGLSVESSQVNHSTSRRPLTAISYRRCTSPTNVLRYFLSIGCLAVFEQSRYLVQGAAFLFQQFMLGVLFPGKPNQRRREKYVVIAVQSW